MDKSLTNPMEGILILEGFFFFDIRLLKQDAPIVREPIRDLYRYMSPN